MKRLLFLLFAISAFAQYPLTVTPWQAIYTNGGVAIPCQNCYLYTYAAGTTTAKFTYTSYTLGATLPNPIRTNSAGYAVSNSNAITGVWVDGNACYHLVYKNSSAVTVWDQDNVCNPAQAAGTVNTALLAYESLIASASGSSHVGFIQPESGAVAQTVQSKLRQNLNILDFGAACNGSTDDKTSVQAGFNSMTSSAAPHTIEFPQNCVISSTVYLPTAAYGTRLHGLALPVFNNQAGGGKATLIAKSGVTPFPMLKIYANSVELSDFGVDCNSVGTVGVMFVSGLWSVANNLQAANCAYQSTINTGDGVQINSTGGTVVNGTVNVAISGTSTTVSSTTLQGETFGDQSCGYVVLDYGGAQMEFRAVTSLVGSTLNFAPATKAHTAPFPIQCKGNNNEIRMTGRKSYGNGEWGLNILKDPGNDTNAIQDEAPVSFGNCTALLASGLCGGSLWSGFGNYTGHGHYEGDHGNAIQLGDTIFTGTGGVGRGTIGMAVSEFTDLEESSAAFNTVADICGQDSSIRVQAIVTQFTPYTSGNSCPAFSGVPDLADGLYNGARCTKGQFGMVCLQAPDGGVVWYDATSPTPVKIGGFELAPGSSGQMKIETPSVADGDNISSSSSGSRILRLCAYGNCGGNFSPSLYPSGGIGLGSNVDPGLQGSQSAVNIHMTTPASSSANCAVGTWTFDATYWYGCTATNTWKRIAWVAF